MALCDFYKKWFHASLDILPKQGSSALSAFTTIDLTDLNTIGDPSISIRTLLCNAISGRPPAAFSTTDAGGYFIFRPTVNALQNSFVDVSSYDEIIDEENRRRFLFKIIAAYNINDVTCSETSPPTNLCPSSYLERLETQESIVFRFGLINTFDAIGCCDLPVDPIGDSNPDPDFIIDCSRVWSIVSDSGGSDLVYYDFDVSPASALVNKGTIFNSDGTSNNIWHDLSWDTRNFLWGLERKGLKRILPGSTGGQAIYQPYASISDSEGVLEAIFNEGIDNTTQGLASLSYNRTNEKMYVFVKSRLFELEPTSNNSWNVTKTGPEVIGAEGVSDLAFDVFGNCYCVFDSDLATIEFNSPVGSGFGLPTKINNTGNLTNVTGLDFVLSLSNDSLITLYASFSSGQIAEVNLETGSFQNVPSASYGAVSIGMASCQVGEDLGSYEVPFYPGETPFVFMIEYTDRMLAVGSGTKPRIQLIREQLSAYINNFIQDGQRIFICLYSSNYAEGFDINLFTTKTSAVNFLNTLVEPSGNSTLCTSALATLSNSTYFPDGAGNNKIKSCVVLSAGNSQDCNSISSLASFFENIYIQALDIRSSNFTIKTVAVNTDISTSHLQQLGSIGNGGYVSWVG